MPGTDNDLVGQAIAELYAADPDEFVDRRRTLVAAARADGDADAAKQIAALRKPTRSAWTVNVLARDDPPAVQRLLDLGDDLRQAEHELDGARLRELSTVRRQLVDDLARRAFMVTEQPAPPAVVREEVLSTLSAAVADPQVADQVGAGTLLRAAHWDGFGSAIRPDLVLLTTPTATRSARPPAPAVPRPDRQARQGRDGIADETPPTLSAAEQARLDRAEAARAKADAKAAEKAAQAEAEAEAALATAQTRLAAVEADERRHVEQMRQAEATATELRAEVGRLRRDVQRARGAVRDARAEVHRVRRR